MIQAGTRLKVADNSGALIVSCIRVLGGSKRKYGHVGDIIICAIKSAKPISENAKGAKATQQKMRKGETATAVIVRTVNQIKRKDGEMVAFNSNDVVIINNKNEPIGTRVFGPVARELKTRFNKILSMAEEVV